MAGTLDQTEFKGGDKTFSMTITLVNPPVWEEFLHLTPTFIEYYKLLFKSIVFESHKYLIRVTPIQTGRLRGGWTGILNKYNIDYSAAFMDVSLLHIPANSGAVLDQGAIREGIEMSQFIDDMEQFDVTIINSVPYAEYVEFGTSKMEGRNYTNKARYKAEYIAKKAFDDWMKKINAEGKITEPNQLEEVAA